jgi:hypothetical protein
MAEVEIWLSILGPTRLPHSSDSSLWPTARGKSQGWGGTLQHKIKDPEPAYIEATADGLKHPLSCKTLEEGLNKCWIMRNTETKWSFLLLGLLFLAASSCSQSS